MRESDLYAPVRDWLIARGFKVHVEHFDCDIVATRAQELAAIELKLGNPQALIRQLTLRTMWADLCYGAMPHRPRETGQFRDRGFGLLVVAGGKVREIIKPRPQPDYWHKRHRYRLKKLQKLPPAQAHELAGLPGCRELRQQRLLRTCPPQPLAVQV